MVRTAKLAVLLALASLVVIADAWADDDMSTAGILGYWLCDSGDCPDEAIEFADNDGVRTYNSWLHDRPSAVDGRWALMGARLTIACCEDIEYQYTVLEVSDERLVLRDVEPPAEDIVLHRPPMAGRDGGESADIGDDRRHEAAAD